MNWLQRSRQDGNLKGWRWGRWSVAGGLLAALVAAVLLSPRIGGWWARRSAANHLRIGAIGAAQRSLAWADSVQGRDARSDLLQAACQRRLGDRDRWQTALEAAEKRGGAATGTRQERALGNLSFGNVQSVSPRDYEALVADGIPPREALHAIVHGLLFQGPPRQAQALIDDWSPPPDDDENDEAEKSFLRGVCSRSTGRREAAQVEFEKALAQQPLHEMARVSLARVLEEQDRLSEALAQHAAILTAAPQRESAQLDLARVLRKSGRLAAARQVLQRAADAADVSAGVAVELAEIEYESGNYDQARRWFERADLEGQHVAETLRSAASNYALAGDAVKAEGLFARVDNAQGLARQMGELQRRIAIDPSDAIAAGELQRLSPGAETVDPPSALSGTSGAGGSALYVEHCAACHGRDGGGNGPAARHLFPRPRNLRRDKYRLVSAASQVPTLADLEQVIHRGMPGTSMPAFANLSQPERLRLAEEVRRLYRERLGGRASEAADADERALSVPDLGEANSQSIARGREVYLRSGCQHCHGDNGAGGKAPLMYDDEGRPTTPRDLVRDLLKGGPDGASLYYRIRLGMPGTPHPASPSLEDAELIAVVQYCQSLSQSPKHNSTNHERAVRAARR